MVSVDVSVLIPQLGETDFTTQAVAAVRRSNGEVDIEVLVHDNGSPDGPGRISSDASVTLSQSAENLGFGEAMNDMARRAVGRYILLLNNDTIVHPDAIARLVSTADERGHRGPVVPMYRDFTGRILELGGGLGAGAKPAQLFRNRVAPTSLTTAAHRADYGSAAAMLVNREQFLAMGGFDDAFAPAYYEDTDLCMRMAELGVETLVEPRAVVFHMEGGTAGTDVSQGLKAFQVEHEATFRSRWAKRLQSHGPVGLRRAVAAGTAPTSGRPRVLWIAPTLPRGDRDGGGRRMVEMITTLSKAGCGLAVYGQSVHDPDRHGRVLSEIGVPWFGGNQPTRWSGDARPASHFDDLPTLLSEIEWDVVVISFARLAERVLDHVREHAPKAACVIDNGDLHFLRYDRARELGLPIHSLFSKERELKAYAATDGVITSSWPEDEVLRQELDIPTHVFTVAPPAPMDLPLCLDGSLMFLGNFGHPPNTDAVVFWHDEIAPMVAKRCGRDVRLRVVGSGTDSLEAASSLEVAGWVPNLSDEFRRTRVFLAPLRYGAGTKGKILEAIAHGIPTVTTEMGAEGFPDEVRDALLIGDDAQQLAAHVSALMTDDAALRAQRERVREAAHTVQTLYRDTGIRLADWLESLAPARPRPEAAPKVKDEVPTDKAQEPLADRPFQPVAKTGASLCPDPVFVVGAPRSGTSMMAHALAQHSAFWTGEESDFLIPLIRHARESWSVGRRRGERHWLSSQGVSWEEFLANLGLGINSLYSERASGLRWVEQTPQYTLILDDLASMFPGARFVYMLRDGRSVVHSLANFVRPVEHRRASALWRRFTEAGLAFERSERGDRLYMMRYEDLVRSPESSLEKLFAFLDAPYEEGTATFIRGGPINSSFENEDSVSKAVARWGHWTRAEREQHHAEAGDLLVRLGFEEDESWIRRNGDR